MNDNTLTDYSQLLFHQTLRIRASTSARFGGSDTEELFEKNCVNAGTRAELEYFGWLERDFSYRFNAQGYRCDEFDTRESFVALGCSFTEGVGVPEDETWPAFLSKQLGLHGWNLGIGGSSPMSVCRNLEPAIRLLRPQFVAILMPPRARVDVIGKDGYSDTYSPMHTKDTYLFHAKLTSSLTSSFLKNWFANTENADLQHKMAMSYCFQVAKDYSVPLVLLDGEETRNALMFTRDKARDLMHDGPKTNAAIAKMFYQQIQNLGV